MSIPEEAIHAATDAIRDDLMRVPADIRALVLGLLIRANEAAAPHIAAEAWEEGIDFYVDGYADVSELLKRNPYRAEQ